MKLANRACLILIQILVLVLGVACSELRGMHSGIIDPLSLSGDPAQNFEPFKATVEKNCNHCHGGAGSIFPAITNFASLQSQNDWIQHASSLVVPGNRAASSVYNRLIHAAGKVPNTNNNMPFAVDGYPVTMTEQDAETIGRYIDSLANSINVQKADTSSLYSSLAKAKYLVHGGAPTAAEVQQVTANGPSGPVLNRIELRRLISSWLQTDRGKAKLDNFLRVTLQQDEWEFPQMGNLLFGRIQNNNPRKALWEQNLKDSFVRTAVDLVDRNEPFTDVVTTRRVAVTTALLSSLSFADGAGRPENINQRSTVFDEFIRNQMIDSDFSDWRFVETQQGNAINYTDLATIRQVGENEVYFVRAPRVGFFNTLAFQIRWPTNIVNDFRNPTSQTLIVSLNEVFEVGDATPEGNLDALDNAHVAPGTACYSCHRLLDPIRETFAAHYDNFYRYSDGGDKAFSTFSFKGFQGSANDIPELATTIASHPKFAQGWVSKYCAYANSEPCDESDEDFRRLVEIFQSSNYNLKTMITELLSSSVVTGKGGGLEGQVVAVQSQALISASRRNHLCHALNTRYREVLTTKNRAYTLANPDLCSLNNEISLTVSTLSADTTTRGAAGLTHSPETNAFSVRSQEKMCRSIASFIVTNDRQQGFDCCEESDVNTSVDDMVKLIMGLPTNHPRYQTTKNGMMEFYNYATTNAGLRQLDALRETFVFACSSPDVVGVGL